MTLKDDLLRRGYLPENLPPSFETNAIADYFDFIEPDNYYSSHQHPTRPSVYSASKRGLSRRAFVLIHPRTAYDLASFVSAHEEQFAEHFDGSTFSQSVPRHTPDNNRAVEIASYSALERALRRDLAPFRFVAKTDISRFYHSIYTHTVPWALHGKALAKANRRPAAPGLPFNRLDYIIRNGQDGQTVGIPVGPDASRYVAEAIATAIDIEFVHRHSNFNGRLVRHVDDVWIGANSHTEAENALWHYREAMRAFELDVNDAKTRILSTDFRVSESWPSEVSLKLDYALSSDGRWQNDRVGAALDYVFQEAIRNEDDGVLKYAIKYVDQSDFGWSNWDLLEPFLMRCAVHFGHTVDYVVRVLVWRDLAHGDVERELWRPVLLSLLQRHGKLGNDSEVAWLLYAALRLRVQIDTATAENIVASCNAIPIVSLLHCADQGLVSPQIFGRARARLAEETGYGPWWPLLLEWKSREWLHHRMLGIHDELVQDLFDYEVTIFNPNKLTSVFSAVEDDYAGVDHAIERRVSLYDHDAFGEEEEGTEGAV